LFINAHQNPENFIEEKDSAMQAAYVWHVPVNKSQE